MSVSGVKGIHNKDDPSDDEFTPLYDDDNDEADQRTAQETKGWNLFREVPLKKESGSMATNACVQSSVKILKVLAYILTFAVVLGSAVIAKGTLFFITSQLKKDREIRHCNRPLALDQQFLTIHSLEERVAWLWAAFIVFGFPEFGLFLRSFRINFFKSIIKPDAKVFLAAFITDTLYAIGTAVLLLIILPELDVVKGAMLMNSMCIVPAVLNAVTRDTTDSRYYIKIVLDVLAISAQVTAFVVWPLLVDSKVLWSIPIACVFISLGWWENYISNIDKHSSESILYLYKISEGLKKARYYTQSYLTIWKLLVFMVCIMLSLHLQEDDPFAFFSSLGTAFGDRTYTVYEYQAMIQDEEGLQTIYNITGSIDYLEVKWSSSLWVSLIQIASAYVCFASAKFACKILIQTFSFTFALSLVGPVTINLLILLCGIRNANPCAFQGTIPDYLFFEIPPVYRLTEFVTEEMAWTWLLWLISQGWITFHTWQPRCERLAATDKLFARPWYNGALIDQSLLMNRTKDEDMNITLQDLEQVEKDDNVSETSSDIPKDVIPADKITRIYVCATMWHETKEEVMEFLKSVIRLDEDQSARRVAQKYLGIVDPDYYELEIHIFFDDAFEVSDHSAEDTQVNRYIKCLVETVDEAASEVHLTQIRLRPPKKYPTPYGGKLEWLLPGKNKMICHMKDKAKIRHKKRWSQVMYMYYLLGHRLMDLPISVDRKEVIADNTYLLALDGDIDFKPMAVTLLVDLMKKNRILGAACGRIHPVGSGFMAWYQKFEYAIGHWLQKATEHVIGCVLCSPGCFSLFRAKALMEDNVMKRYTLTSHEARHFVQYDQGEDRWLCTLLLQRGYRVEYSAALDAYTHCPERFDEFFNQRRRWVPSTMANILDLLSNAKYTVKVNDNISTLYIAYQILLMFGTVLGPGTIFLMLVGAMNAITGITNMNALILNLVPISIFVFVCMTCKSQTQLVVANVITSIYAMLMLIVMMGIVLQMVQDGWQAPSSIFTIVTFGIFFITAVLHPQEIDCLMYLFIYYITIPSMYLLLIVYSLCNLNDVSWGTREVAEKKTAKEMENEKKAAEEAKKKMDNQSILKYFGKTEETTGGIELGVAGLFKCMCCTHPKDHKDELHLLQIATSLDKIDKRLESLGSHEHEATIRRRSSMGLRRDSLSVLQEYEESEVSTELPRDDRDDLVNPYWVDDPDLQKGEVDFLTTAETEFWKDFIDTYLRPIDENKEEKARIATDLKNLRDKIVFAFIMVNAIFILIIFLLQLNQDQLHIRWPFAQQMEISYDDSDNMILIESEYLMLEPIGFLFLFFFGSVMIIQFIAMLVHRLGTLTHLLSTTKLNWYIIQNPDELSDKAIIEKQAVEIAKDLQKLNMDDLEPKRKYDTNVHRRKTIHNLEISKESKPNVINLDANFKRRLTMLQDANAEVLARIPSLGATTSTRRATLRALRTRRESVTAERRRSQQHRASANTFLYEPPDDSLLVINPRDSAMDSEDEAAPPRQRRSTVRFMEKYE